MKNFLKSTAIFACIALMFCACSEDTTVDLGGTNGGDYIETFVEAPSDVAVQPGNGIAVLSFIAAEDEYISKCDVTWVNNDDAEDAGSRTISVEAGEPSGYTITGLKDGTYTVTVVSIMDDSNKTSEETSVEVTVYDESTYENQMPEIIGMEYDSSVGVTIYLSYVTQECTALEVAYYTYAGDYSSSTTAAVDIADPGAGTILSGAKLGENFYLVGYFRPEGGYDDVVVKVADIFEAEDEIGYPDGVAAYVGYKRIMVYWDLEADAASNLDATYISYTNTSDPDAKAVVVSYSEWDFEDDNVSQKLELSGLDAGNYTVGIYNFKEGDAQINILSIENLMVYDESSFSLPAVTSIAYKSDDKVYIEWGETPEHVIDMSFAYTSVADEVSDSQPLTDLTETTILESGAKEGSEIIVSATYHPEYAVEGLDAKATDYVDVSTVVGEGTTIPEQLPTALSDLVFTMGYDATSEEENKSQLNISWTAVADDDNISNIVVYYGVGTSPSSYEAVEIATTETSYTFSGLIKNVTYTGYVVSQKASAFEEGVMISSEVADAQMFSLKAYDDVTYETSLPSYSVTNSLAVDVTFGTLSSDLVSITVTPDAGDVVTMTRAELVEASNKLSFAQGEATSFTYTATLMPSYGATAVVLSSETITIPEVQLTSPTDVAVEYGYDSAADGKGAYINVTWTAPTDAMLAYISGYKLYYTIGEGDLQTVSGIDKSATSYNFENIADDNLGEYSIYVAYVDVYDNDSVPCDALSAVAYAPAYYTALPSLMVIEADGVLTLSWGTSGLSNDFVSVAYTYGTAAAVEILAADIATEVALDYEAGYNSVSFTATFCPVGGVGNVVIAGETAEFTEPAPTAPEAVTISKYGYNETDGSYVTVEWTKPATSMSAIANYKAYAIYEDGTATDAVDVAMSGSDSESYTFTSLDTDKIYTFYVASETESDTASAYTSVTAENATYSPATFALPSVALAFCSDLVNVNISWADVSESLVSVTTSYTNGDDSTLETTTAYADITSGTTFAYTSGYSAFTYSASFMPSYGADAVTVAGGEGTIVLSDPDLELASDGTYNIYSAVGLAAFADLVNGTDVYYSSALKSGSGFPEAGSSNLTINGTLVKDIDLSTICGASVNGEEVSWTPIANYATATANIYKGTFDGNSKTIDNLYINTADLQAQGLFGYIASATIKNLTLSNISVTATINDTSTRHVSGGLVGFATASTISGCEVSGGNFSVTGGKAGDVGVIVGRMSAATTIEKCINRASATSTVQQFGGIVGNLYNSFSGTSGSTGTIKECYNYGKITGTSFAAGIIGYFFATGADSTIEDCYNYGEIYCTAGNNAGIVGSVRAATGTTGLVVVSNCHNYAPVTSTSSTYIGGVTGQASTNGGSVTVTGCSNNADVTAAANLVGGVVGAEVTGTGVLSIINSTNIGAIQGTTNVGGIIGLTVGSSVLTGDSSTISNTGSVAATNAAGIVGGIVGTNTGTVTGYNNSGMVTMGGVNVNGTDVNGIYGSSDAESVTSSVDSYVVAAAAEAVTVSPLTYTDGVDGVVVTWAYSAGSDNISSVVIYYKASSETSYSSKVISGNTDTTYTLSSEDGIANGSTYNVYVETENKDGVTTAAISGGTSSEPLSITLSTEDLSAADIKLVAAGDTYGVDTYEIYTAKGLAAFNDLVSGTTYYVGTSTNDESVIDTNNTITSWSKTAAANAILMADIDLSTICSASLGSWYPIGGTGATYAGIFNGNSKTISNLYILADGESNSITSNTVGFFGYSTGATIKDVTFVNPNVTAASTICAVVSGRVTGSATISNCTVSGGAVTGGQNLGAIVGTLTSGTVAGCTNSATITTVSGTTTSNGTGGIVGKIVAGSVEDCTNNGAVSGLVTTGGIVGYVTAGQSVLRATNYGSVTNTNSGAYTGGIVGWNLGTLTGDTASYSYNYGTVTGGVAATSGGIVGANGAAGVVSYYKNTAVVIVGDVTLNKSDTTDESKYGVYGTNSGTVSECADEYVYVAPISYDIYLNDSGVYEISTAAGLQAFEQLVNGTAATTTPEVTTNVDSWTQNLSASATLMDDINLSTVCSAAGSSWTPIGTNGSAYAGTFDGNSKTISNLYIDNSATTATYQALFGSVSGTVKSFTLFDPTVKAYSYVGAVAGNVTATGTISGVTLSATSVTAIGTGSEASSLRGSSGSSLYSVYTYNPGSTTYTGGITGLNAGTVVGCSNNLNVGTGATSAGLADSSNSGCYIGGIAGSNTGTIEGSSNSGYVFGRNTVGGIAGLSNSQTALVVGCSNSGTLYSNTYTGGMVGQITNGIVVACYNTGDIDGPSSSAIIGGMVGRDSSSTVATVIGCFSYKGLLGPTLATSETASGYIWGTTTANAIVTACYYMDSEGDLAEAGVKNPNASASIDATEVADIAALVSAVDAMNTAIGTSYGYQFSATTLNADGAPSIVAVE